MFSGPSYLSCVLAAVVMTHATQHCSAQRHGAVPPDAVTTSIVPSVADFQASAPVVYLEVMDGCRQSVSGARPRLSSLDSPAACPAFPWGKLGAVVVVPDATTAVVELQMDATTMTGGNLISPVSLAFTIPCPTDGKHVIRARYLYEGVWSEWSNPIRFRLKLPEKPVIVALGNGDKMETPVPVSAARPTEIDSPSMLVRLQNLAEGQSIIAFVDGKQVPAVTVMDCCLQLNLRGVIAPGLHTITVRATPCSGDCGVMSDASDAVAFRYYSASDYVLNSFTQNSPYGSPHHLFPSLNRPPLEPLNSMPIVEQAPQGNPSSKSNASEPSTNAPVQDPARPQQPEVENLPPETKQELKSNTLELKMPNVPLPNSEDATADIQLPTLPIQNADYTISLAAWTGGEMSTQLDVMHTNAKASVEAIKTSVDDISTQTASAISQARLAENTAVIIGANRVALQMKIQSISQYLTSVQLPHAQLPSGNQHHNPEREALATHVESVRKAISELQLLDSQTATLAHRVIELGTQARDHAARAEQIRDYGISQIADVHREMLSFSSRLNEAHRLVANNRLEEAEVQRQAAAAHLTHILEAQQRLAAQHDLCRDQATATGLIRTQAERLIAESQILAQAPVQTVDGNATLVENIQQSASPFYFASAAHFPIREFGRHGELIEREGLVIYEDMRLAFEPDGQYQISFRVRNPKLPVTLNLQLLIQTTQNSPVYTVTLDPISIQPCTDNGPSELLTYCGQSEVLRRCYSQFGTDTRLRRQGTARFGFGISRDESLSAVAHRDRDSQ